MVVKSTGNATQASSSLHDSSTAPQGPVAVATGIDTETPAGADRHAGTPTEDEWSRSTQSADQQGRDAEDDEDAPELPSPKRREGPRKVHQHGSDEFNAARAAIAPATVKLLDDLLRADFKYVEELDEE
ncbi:MAG: hypothetical protein ACQKBV_10570 [Puniceicoccales bacterium]